MSEFEHPIKDVTDSLLGWATQAELELAQRLNHPNVTIIGDLDLASDEVERIEKLYGIFLARQLAAGGNLAELTALSPALFLVTLTARAKKLVAADTFSREYLGGIGLNDLVSESQIDSILADKLAEYLTNMQVSAFDTDPVTVLCWHAGFVNTEIPQLLETIDTVAAEHDNPTIDDLELPHYFSGFHQVSPHAAILYQGVMALRDFTITHPQSWFDRDRKHLEPQLPTAIADAVAAELRERPVGTEDRAAAVGVANRELRPRLILDPVRKKVCLRLPEQRVPARGEITWRVSLEGSAPGGTSPATPNPSTSPCLAPCGKSPSKTYPTTSLGTCRWSTPTTPYCCSTNAVALSLTRNPSTTSGFVPSSPPKTDSSTWYTTWTFSPSAPSPLTAGTVGSVTM